MKQWSKENDEYLKAKQDTEGALAKERDMSLNTRDTGLEETTTDIEQ